MLTQKELPHSFSKYVLLKARQRERKDGIIYSWVHALLKQACSKAVILFQVPLKTNARVSKL